MIDYLDDKLPEFVICLPHKHLMKCKLSWLIIFKSEFRLKHESLFRPFVVLLEHYCAFLTWRVIISFYVDGL